MTNPFFISIVRALQNGAAEDTCETRETKKRKLEATSDDGENVTVLAGGTHVLALPSGPVPCNDNLVQLIDICKPEIRQLVEHSNLVSTIGSLRYYFYSVSNKNIIF